MRPLSFLVGAVSAVVAGVLAAAVWLNLVERNAFK